MELVMSNEVTTIEETDPQPNVINYAPIFPVLTAQVLLDLPLDDMVEDALKLASDTKNSDAGYSTFFNNQDLGNIRNVSKLREAIYGVCCAFGRELKFETNYDKSSIHLWLNVTRRGDHHPPLLHQRSVFAGIFHARIQEDIGPIVLLNPTASLRGHEPFVEPQDQGPFTASAISLSPALNTLHIWPAWMMSSIPTLTVSGPYISFGFTIDFLPPGA